MKKTYSMLAALALMLTLAHAGAQGAAAIHHGHDHAHKPHDQAPHGNAARARRRSQKARGRSARRGAVSYVCPMHPDMRSRSRGECPKCGMALVAAGRASKAAPSGEAGNESRGHSNR
jgi:Cu+-exporting ATPase